ncbi:MAG: hypothetical protein NTW08_05100 [Gammaproteobacteria bacterium]|nr:hypothetical protein [Gammaproteobacteria bacterium]
MYDMICRNLIDGLVSNTISSDELIKKLSINPSVQPYLDKTIEAAKTDPDAKTALFTSLSLFLVEHGLVYTENRSETIRRLKKGAVLSLSAFALDEGRQELKRDSATWAQDLVHVPIPIFVLGYAALSEYQYYNQSQKLDASLSKLIQGIESDIKQQNMLYQLLEKTHQTQLDALPEHGTPEQNLARQTLISQWKDTQNYFRDYLNKSQQNIACLGAEIQQADSQQRVSRVRTSMNFLAYGLHAVGPVGAILSMTISGIGAAAQLASIEYTAHTARHNHAVLSNPELVIHQEKDLLHALNVIRRLDNATVTLNDEHIIECLPGESEEKACARFKKEHPNATLCQLAPYPEKSETPTPTLTNQDDILIEQTLIQAKHLKQEIIHYQMMIAHLMSKYEPNMPILSNLDEIEQSLSVKMEHLENRLTFLSGRPLTAKQSKELEGASDQFINELTPYLEGLIQIKNEIATTYASYYSELSKHDPRPIGPLVPGSPAIAFCEEQKAQLLFNISSITHLLQACERMGNGRNIQNLPVLIQDNLKKIKLLGAYLSNKEKENLMAQLNHIYKKGVQLDEVRIDYLQICHQHHGIDTEAYAHEISLLKTKLSTYPKPFMDLRPGYLIDRLPSIPRVKHTHTPISSCIRTDKVHKNTQFICPSRQAFGLLKSTKQKKEVLNTTKRLFREDPADTLSIQITPMTKCDLRLLASTRGDEKKLADVAEGLKTEMQWVNALCQELNASETNGPIDNLKELIHYYDDQIQFLKFVIDHRAELLNDTWDKTYASHHNLDPQSTRNLLARLGSLTTNTVRGSGLAPPVLQNIQTQLDRCVSELKEMKVRLNIVSEQRAFKATNEENRSPSPDNSGSESPGVSSLSSEDNSQGDNPSCNYPGTSS